MAVMHAAYLGQLVTQCRELCAPTTSDFALLSRFAHRHDADAFAQLVHRHAASVWAVCRRLLVSEADREDADQIEQWIAALDSSDFATREAATKDLGRHLLAAGPVLHAALAKQPTLEQRRRIESLLQQHDRLRPRMALMVSVLSHLETLAARRLLDHWAETDPTGPLGGAAALAKDRRQSGFAMLGAGSRPTGRSRRSGAGPGAGNRGGLKEPGPFCRQGPGKSLAWRHTT
jgi:hypothetical protein